MGIGKFITRRTFPEGNFQQIKANAPSQRDYNIRTTEDLVGNLPGGLARDVFAPAAAGIMSVPYDAIQAATRVTENDINRAMGTAGMSGPKDMMAEAYGLAYGRENPLSSAYERMVGASAPLANRINNFNIGSAQASIPTQEDRVKASIAQQMINEGTATPMARRTYGDMSMGYGRPRYVADRSPVQQGLNSIDIGRAPSIYTIDPAMMHAAKMQRMNRGKMNNYPMINRITDRVSSGLGTLQDNVTNTATGFYDTIGGGIKSILDYTFLGKIAAARDATNPRAGNYNPRLQGQIDFMKEQGLYGVNPNSGLNQITGGVLTGKNLQSMFGSNDLGSMYDKALTKATNVLENLPNQWSNLKETDPDEYAKKFAWHQNKVAKIKKEQDIFKANQQKKIEQNIADEKAKVRGYNISQRRAGRGGDHMSRSRDQGGLGISASQAQAVSDANRAAGMTGWGLKEGGLASLWRR